MDRNISKHISKGNIQVKMKQPSSKPVNRSHNSGSYKLYLKSGSNLPKVNQSEQDKSKDGNKKVNIQRKKQKVNKESTIRIIRQQDKSSKSKNKFTRKKPSKIKDINEIEKQIEKQNEIKKEVKKQVKKEVKQKIDKKDNKRLSKRSNKRKIRRSTKRNSRNVRKFSIKKHKKVSGNDMKRVEQKINSIRNKKSSEIKKELEKEGIKVSGKSNRLLKDIYFYSKVCNINIKHE